MIFSQSSVLAALAVSSTVGTRWLPPARHAAQLDPVEALGSRMRWLLIISLLIGPVLAARCATVRTTARQYSATYS